MLLAIAHLHEDDGQLVHALFLSRFTFWIHDVIVEILPHRIAEGLEIGKQTLILFNCFFQEHGNLDRPRFRV